MKRIRLDKKDLKTIQQYIETTYGTLDNHLGLDDIKIDVATLLKTEKEQAILVFSTIAYAKMAYYVMSNAKEIAWHGIVEKHDGNIYYVKDVTLYPQEVTSVTVDTDDAEYAQWTDSLDDETYNTMRFQGHSHVDMNTSPSGTDIDYYNKRVTDLGNEDFYVFLIMNKKHEMWYKIYDMSKNIIFETDDITFAVVDENNKDIISAIDEDKEKFVKDKTYKTATTYTGTSQYTSPTTITNTVYGYEQKSTTAPAVKAHVDYFEYYAEWQRSGSKIDYCDYRTKKIEGGK